MSEQANTSIHLLAIPGIRAEEITTYTLQKVEERFDAFYIMDGSRWGASVSNAVSNVAGVDNNYVATYFPWVRILNPGGGAQIWVPPSVVMAGAYANNDDIGQEWFAPAGLNRGLIAAQDVKKILTHTDRDELYDGRVNPIASFPQQGIVAFGQKTLQSRPSALDRVNVRRMMLHVKKGISRIASTLLFDQNVDVTWKRFSGQANAFLADVQSQLGLTEYRVVLDETTTTPDLADRNTMYAKVFLKPARSIEFIAVDFVIQKTGASFDD